MTALPSVSDVSGAKSKAEAPIVVTELPIVTEVSEVLLIKAEAPIDVTELGIVTEVSRVDAKAPAPIDVTELPIATEVSEVLPEKAPALIDVTELGIVTEVSRLTEKAEIPIDVTESGMVIEERFRFINALALIAVTPLGITAAPVHKISLSNKISLTTIKLPLLLQG